MMKSMKPNWLFAMFVVERSMNWLTGRFKPFSLSPWSKNSMKSNSVHFSQSSKLLVGFEMSAIWKYTSAMKYFSSSSLLGSRSSDKTFYLKIANLLKCVDISVAKIALIMRFLTYLYSAVLRWDKILNSSCDRISNAVAA